VKVFGENVFVVEGFLGLGRNTEALAAAAKARFVVCAYILGEIYHNLIDLWYKKPGTLGAELYYRALL
jgi:hypothetical protein